MAAATPLPPTSASNAPAPTADAAAPAAIRTTPAHITAAATAAAYITVDVVTAEYGTRMRNAVTPAAESPGTLATRAEQLPEGASAALLALAGLPRARGISLRAGRGITWERVNSQEAALGYTRGEERVEEACAFCERGAGPFVKCVVVQGMLSGSCTNCHYVSGGAECSLRPSPTQVSDSVRARRRNANIRRVQRYRELAKVYRALANLYDEEADQEVEDELKAIEAEIDSEETMEE